MLATLNKNKVIEYNKICKPYNISFLSLAEFTNISPEEDGKNFEENAIIKAKNAGNLTNWQFPCLADDSGLCIKILKDRPGKDSAKWAEKVGYPNVFNFIKDKINDLGKEMNDQPAFFICCLALLYSPKKKKIFNGKLSGKLLFPPNGNNGFGYDPIFIPAGKNKTLAQLSSLEKNQISHRNNAVKKLIGFIFEK
ncbi:MAG: RdgB/HAM1 family non-canonical purine NTP pyrophosphatase [Pseudomonadota bacterium]|nr:RdgB/HAM1 family non-canonical purine NTP pyrophosphatase [Pseudomonadota bacterium]